MVHNHSPAFKPVVVLTGIISVSLCYRPGCQARVVLSFSKLCGSRESQIAKFYQALKNGNLS